MAEASTTINATNRHTGLDIFRCFAMFLVVCTHVQNHGGVLSNISSPLQEFFSSGLWLISICCVNCFALLSGYVGYGKKHKLVSYFETYLQVLFYLIAFYIIGRIALPECHLLVRDLLPISGDGYWYFTAYSCMFCFLPMLDAAISLLEKKKLAILLVITGIIFCFSTIVMRRTPWYSGINNGFSSIWLIYLYCIGGYLKRHSDVCDKIKIKWCIIGMVIIMVINYFSYHYLGNFPYFWRGFVKDGESIVDSRYIQYTSPTILIQSILLLVVFSKFNISGRWKTFWKILSVTSFGVYLVHVHNIVVALVLKDNFIWITQFNGVLLLLLVLGASLVIYVTCTLIEIVRVKLFVLIGISRLNHKIVAYLPNWAREW